MTTRRKSQLAICNLPLSSLKLNPKNPRIHSAKQTSQIAQSILRFGFNVPILVDAGLNVIAGHGRALAARSLDWKSVPVIRLEHLSEAQIRAFSIADNRLCENAQWDESLLGEQLKILADSDLDFSLEITGFETTEIDLLIDGLAPSTEADPADDLPEDQNSVVTQPGDLWQLGRHQVLCADSLEGANYQQLMKGKRARVVIADPPYNVRIDGHASGRGKIHHRDFAMASGEMSPDEFTRFLNTAMKVAATHSAAGAISFYFIDWRHIGELLAASKDVYSELLNLCVWTKDNGGMGSFYRSGHELVFVFKNGKSPHQNNVQLGRFGRYRTNVWSYPGANSFSRSSSEGNLLALHPTVKPVALVADAILDCSARGEIVLDPFLGSGTTVIAAECTGRVSYGLEIDPRYVDIIIRRWQAFTGKSAEHEASGRSFRELEETSNVK